MAESDPKQASGMLMTVGTWLVQTFGPTEAILLVMSGAMFMVVMGWVSSPMLQTMQAIREDQIKQAGAVALAQQRISDEIAMHTTQTTLLRTICVHDSSNDQQRAECWK